VATAAEKLSTWKMRRAEIKALKAAYFAKKAEAAAIYQDLQAKEQEFLQAEEALTQE
jgi:hypothetical protein